jgi:hypothetical protein
MKMSLPGPSNTLFPRLCQALLLTSAILLCGHPSSSPANVYATHIQLNGGTTNVNYSPGNPLAIGYILNDAATAGVSINISAGSTVVRTLVFTNGGPGTARGTNLVTWDGLDSGGSVPPGGTYSVAITAAASGYDNWTQITDDSNLGNYVWEPRGIAVNRNSSSPYYGRVFVANATAGPNPTTVTGDAVGLQKLNADGSAADEGIFSTGGWGWAGDYYSPWKVEVSADDYVYVNDWTGNGIILRWDQVLSSNSMALVLRSDNWPNGGAANMSGPAISGSGTNTHVWMADINSSNNVGVRTWTVGANGLLATNDLGATAVAAGPGFDLSLFPYDVAVDSSNQIYTIQYVQASPDLDYRVMRFAPYAPGGPARTNADWKIGSGDDTMRGAFGIAVSPDGTHVAVAFVGNGIYPNRVGGAARVFMATNGADVVSLSPDTTHDHTDVAWDNVGNLYTVDNFDSVWRAYSPPGTNFATTVCTASVFFSGPPVLSAPTYTNGLFQFTLNGVANTSYVILTSSNLFGWTPVTTNTAPSATRVIQLPAPLKRSFYRAMVAP